MSQTKDNLGAKEKNLTSWCQIKKILFGTQFNSNQNIDQSFYYKLNRKIKIFE